MKGSESIAGHHPACPVPYDECLCADLWQAEEDAEYRDNDVDLYHLDNEEGWPYA